MTGYNPNWPTITVQADFVNTPNSGVQSWTNINDGVNVIVDQFTTSRGRQYELDKIEAGTATITAQDLNEYLNPANTSSPWNSAGKSLSLYRQVQIQATWAGTTYPLFTGYIERYAGGWQDSGFRGQRTLTCIDAMATLQRRVLSDITAETVQSFGGSYRYFPLNDSQSSTGATDSTGQYRWTFANRNNGSLGASNVPGVYKFGTSNPGGSWLSSSLVRLTPHWPGATGYDNGQFLFAPATDFLSGSTWTVACAFSMAASTDTTNNPGASTVMTVFTYLPQTNSNPTYVVLTPTPTAATLQYQTGPNTNVAISLTGYTNNLADGRLHTLVVVANGGSGVTAYIDGVSVGTNATPANVGTGQAFAFGGNLQSFNVGDGYWAGLLGNIALNLTNAWTPTQVTQYDTAIRTGFNGDLTSTRITNLLNIAGFVGYGTSVDTANSAEYAALINGQTLRTAVEQSTTTESGILYCTGDGKLRFKSRATTRGTTTSAYTFGDGGGELPYQGDLSFSYDPSHVANQVTVNNADGYNTTVIDTSSTTTYGPLSLSISTDYANDSDAYQASNWYLSRYSQPALRIEKLTLNPAATPALWPAVLGLDIGQMITLNRRPPAGATISGRFTVQRVEHNVAPGSWVTTMWLSPAIVTQALIVDNATYGAIDSYPISD